MRDREERKEKNEKQSRLWEEYTKNEQ